MRLSKVLSGASLAVALVAFGLAGALSLRSHVEPFYAVLRSVGAFGGVLFLARWSASALESVEGPAGQAPPAEQRSKGHEAGTRRPTRAGNRL